MTINEIICLPVQSEFVKILIGRIPHKTIMYVAGILEKMVKEFWQNTFVTQNF